MSKSTMFIKRGLCKFIESPIWTTIFLYIACLFPYMLVYHFFLNRVVDVDKYFNIYVIFMGCVLCVGGCLHLITRAIHGGGIPRSPRVGNEKLSRWLLNNGLWIAAIVAGIVLATNLLAGHPEGSLANNVFFIPLGTSNPSSFYPGSAINCDVSVAYLIGIVGLNSLAIMSYNLGIGVDQ